MADFITKLSDMIDPEVMADMVSRGFLKNCA